MDIISLYQVGQHPISVSPHFTAVRQKKFGFNRRDSKATIT